MSDERLLATFLDLVRIDSPTGCEAGVAEYCARVLADTGATVRFDDTTRATGADVGNLIAEVPGSVPGTKLLLCAHMDCVDPCEGVKPIVEDGWVRTDGSTVLGGDDKVGVAAILEVVRRIVESGADHAGIEVLLTVSEEQGLKGAKALDAADVGADLCLVLDADGAVGGIVTGAPTHHTFVATVSGRAAHAGLEPERGVSAIAIASRAIAAMRLGRLDEATTANIGTVSGGLATNVVAPSAVVTGECRSLDASRAESVRSEMETALRHAAEAAGGRVDIVWTREYVGFDFACDDPLVHLVSGAAEDAGLTPHCLKTGGGSDGNILTGLGLPTLVLSTGMTGVHSTEERVEIAELERLARLLEAIVARAAG